MAELQILSVYRTRFSCPSELVMITGIFSYGDFIENYITYHGFDLLTGSYHLYRSHDLWSNPLDLDEYRADVTCSLDNKDLYVVHEIEDVFYPKELSDVTRQKLNKLISSSDVF